MVPLRELDADLKKTGLLRARDALQLVLSLLEAKETFAYPERVNQFVDRNSTFVLGVLFDPERIDIRSMVIRAIEKFDKSQATCGIPVRAILVMGIRNLESWVAATL
jgi:hypothetical protein